MTERARAIDALVAEKVMGWTNIRLSGSGRLIGEDDGDPDEKVLFYSTHFESAWDVVEELCKRADFDLSFLRDVGLWQASFDASEHGGEAMNQSAALAICQAALKFVGVTPPDCYEGDGVW